MNVNLSVIIPAFNESDNLEKKVLDEVADYLKKLELDYEVIIVDDGSTDGTAEKIASQIKNKAHFKLIKNSHQGKAVTVMTGLLASKGAIALFTDMDQATPISELDKFLPKFKQGVDVVIGSRHGRKGAPVIRKISAWGFSFLRNLILGLPFSDTQCGFKAFNRSAIEAIFPTLLEARQKVKQVGAAVNAGFDVEMLFIATKKNLKIEEVAVNWRYVESERVPFLSNAVEAIRDMLRVRLNDLQGKYN